MDVRNITIIDNLIYEEMIITQEKQKNMIIEDNKRCIELHDYIIKRKKFLDKLNISLSKNYVIDILNDIEKIMKGDK